MNILRPTDIRRKSDKKNSKRKIAILAGTILFLLVLGGGIYGIRRSSLFAVQSIVVLGVPDAYGQQVIANIEAFSKQHSFMTKLLGSRNMIVWGGDERSFLAAYPDIKEMRIEKKYAKHVITLTIVVREKFGVWCQQGSVSVINPDIASSTDNDAQNGVVSEGCYWFDTDGVLFAKAPLIKSELFNRVLDSTGRSLALRDKAIPDRLFENLTRIFKLLEVAQINTKTVSLSDLALEQVTANSISDPRIIFSLRFDPTFALSAIDALKKTGEWNRLQYANFTVENKVAYK